MVADLARALVPRSITVALALPIAAQLGAPAPIVAAGVCLTGLLGANFAQSLLNRHASHTLQPYTHRPCFLPRSTARMRCDLL